MDASRFSFFGNPANDVQLLTRWRSAPLTYHVGQPLPGAHTDHYEELVVENASAELFERAADQLLRYHFYPDDVMVHVSDFSVEKRRMHVGDHIVQRIRAVRPFVDVLTMNAVVEVIDEPRCTGFAYATTQMHDEIGRWSARIEWRDLGELMLTIHSIGRANVPSIMQPLARRTQLRAHRRGIEYFRQAVLSRA